MNKLKSNYYFISVPLHGRQFHSKMEIMDATLAFMHDVLFFVYYIGVAYKDGHYEMWFAKTIDEMSEIMKEIEKDNSVASLMKEQVPLNEAQVN